MNKKLDRIAYIDKLKPKSPKNSNLSQGDKIRILISIMLSARTKDELTEKVAEKLFSKYSSKELCKLSENKIMKLIYPVGFYRTKAKHIKELCKIIKFKFKSHIPNNITDLLTLPGVGRKTANLFLSTAYNKDTICVDVHVHRISNRLGLVKTRTPFETEKALEGIFPERSWSKINSVFVPFGKKICKPIHPNCEICPLREECSFYNTLLQRKSKDHSI